MPEIHERLKTLSLKSCEKIETLPKLPNSLEVLILKNAENFLRLPEPLPKGLKILNCQGCDSLEELPFLPNRLEELYCHCCENLKKAHNIPSSLKKFWYWGSHYDFERQKIVN